ncbi:MAG: hypothetical protein EB084_22320, partial [Proteobacteria bacterium]|nr:hypothetical protein [Pseudomonadota bacterium]
MSAFLIFSGPAWAHWADLATADVIIDARGVEMSMVLPTGLLGRVDDNGDGRMSEAELGRHRREVETLLRQKVALEVDGRMIAESLVSVPDVLPAGGAGAPSLTHSPITLRWSLT